ncbi:uncharacterized protein [Macrobrachium rosenbergii]|uniref:uncharacterized protein n=1 Tax=Macrobrachium rosenbergii TaxID=79674 RepID=UPI0034D72084
MMITTTLSPLVSGLQESIKDVDLRSFTPPFDLLSLNVKTVSWLALATIALLYLFSVFGKYLVPVGRSLAVNTAEAWENNVLGLNEIGRSSPSLQPYSEILDALARAVKKWEDPQISESSSEVNKNR